LAFIQYPLFGILKNLHKKTGKNDEKSKTKPPEYAEHTGGFD
jgi:hypothetical protein